MINLIKKFLQLESTGGMVLLSMTILALILNNSAGAWIYQELLYLPLVVNLGSFHYSQPMLFWINDGLMSIFFLLVGLELKREYHYGELAEPSKVILPAMAAIGGMLIPAILYVCFNLGDYEALKGWAIPVATDIAFALGVLSLFGKRVPLSLKMFLLTLAIFDDIVAIIIIALFYTQSLSYIFLIGACFSLILLWTLNLLKIKPLFPYLFLGFLLWICMLRTGIHPTIAGVLLALMIPLDGSESASPLSKLENILHPWVVYFVIPLFAFANAGVSFSGLSLNIFTNTITVGIIVGLILGKQLGVLLFAWMAVKIKWATLPENISWFEIYGVAVLCGIGFTMSLFFGILAFENEQSLYLTPVRLGVLCGSLISGLCGAIVLGIAFSRKKQKAM